ncbi:MAG: RNA polymerase factor sigma-54 [Oscillibacter sp.]
MDMQLHQKQTQTLSPQMLQAMKILQMGTQELTEYIQETLQENPTLESDEQMPAMPEVPVVDEELSLLRRKLDWLEDNDCQNSWYHRQEDEERTEGYDFVAQPAEETLFEHLRSQVRFEKLPRTVALAVGGVMSSLNDCGYLDEPLSELALRFGVEEAVAARALRLVQNLEPVGVGARNLSECLCLQLKRQGETGLAVTIARQYLEALSRDRYNQIAKETHSSREEVQEACRRIRSLNPKPGAAFGTRDTVRYVTPDLRVVWETDHFEVYSNDQYFPSLHISGYYRQLSQSTEDAQVKDYLNGKLRQANWVVHSVDQRRSTLLACARCLVQRQENFFRLGPGHLRPMSLQDIATELDIHESTVSRAIKDKHLQCDRGVFPLSYFFSRCLGGGGEDGTSTDKAKAAIQTLIAGEDPQKPLSDQKLVELLAQQGVELSRRTVAKYREELGIASTMGRKKF